MAWRGAWTRRETLVLAPLPVGSGMLRSLANVTTTALLLPLALVFILLTAACSAKAEPRFPEVLTIRQGDVTPLLASSELVVGENRFVMGILDPEGRPIVDAKVHLTFYNLNDGKEIKKESMDAVSRVPARDAGITEQVEHRHADGSRHVHINAGEEIGVYTAMVNFDRAGIWGVEIQLDSQNPKVNK